MEIKNIITKHISYTAAADMQEICKPLFDNLNLNLFSMSRYYHNGSCAHLTTCQKALHHHIMKNNTFCGPLISAGIHLWNNYAPPEILNDFATYFGLHNGITLCNKNTEYLELFNLAAPASNSAVIDAYFNNLDLLEQYLLYFKDKASKLITQASKERLMAPKTDKQPLKRNDLYKTFSDSIKAKKIYLNTGTTEIILSQREYDVQGQL
ncbi:MAG: hypothetical protein KAT71_05840 [Gammaproteobacteria bacterium]|nr:hypothetical protein [Gammaproteobacteria bacterium]